LNQIFDEYNLGNYEDRILLYWDVNYYNIRKTCINNNFWGDSFFPQYHLYPNDAFDYLQIWLPSKSTMSAETLYFDALDFFANEDYTAAVVAFKDLIENHAETPFAQAAMHELFALEQFTNNDFVTLHNYFVSFTESDSTLYDKAQFLATRCNVRQKEWDAAINWYENRIENPPSYPDSVFAVIDLGEIHLLMEEDDEFELKARPVTRFPQLRPQSRAAFETKKTELLATLPQINKTKTEFPLANGNSNGALGQNIPNPATESTTVVYEIYTEGTVEISIYNILGQLIQTIPQGFKKEGVYQVEISLVNIPTGVYSYALFVDGERIDSKKLIKN
jgi:tetratricopeptide (TPR) repeat protein